MMGDSHFGQLGSAQETVACDNSHDETQSPGLTTGDCHLRWAS